MPNTYGSPNLAPEQSVRESILNAVKANVQGASPATRDAADYLGNGLPYDIEGLLRNYALKFGDDAAKELLQRLPTMGAAQLKQVAETVAGASSEADAERKREANRPGGMGQTQEYKPLYY